MITRWCPSVSSFGTNPVFAACCVTENSMMHASPMAKSYTVQKILQGEKKNPIIFFHLSDYLIFQVSFQLFFLYHYFFRPFY